MAARLSNSCSPAGLKSPKRLSNKTINSSMHSGDKEPSLPAQQSARKYLWGIRLQDPQIERTITLELHE